MSGSPRIRRAHGFVRPPLAALRTLAAIANSRLCRAVMPVVLTVLLAALLVATIVWTRFDPTWLAFLGGVVFAAVLALASQASKAEWLVARRTLQLERLREQLAEESARARSATEGMRLVDTKMRLMSDALPSMVLYVGRDGRCHYHNRPVEEKTGLTRERIHGQPLREITGYAVYPHIEPHIASALDGKTVDYEFAWDSAAGEDALYSARHVPYFAEDAQPRGFYLVLTQLARRPAPAPAVAPVAEPAPAVSADVTTIVADASESLYLRSMASELMHSDDPRAKLAQALAQDEFLLYAQKILSLKGGAPDPVCFEILLRLREEEDNLLPPGGFIPIAERYGMMPDLDRWVVRNLISWCTARQRAEPGWRTPLYCVNLSEAVLGNADFARFVRSELQACGFPGQALAFEITEQDAINHHADVRRLMAALRPAGCRFTIDSFGSSKVSFSYLKGLQVDFIKIDGNIILNLMRDPAELAKTRAINTVCKKLGVRTIAETVETREALTKLREIGVDYVQGFGIARPGPIAQQQ